MNKLFGASILVLGLAASPAFAYGPENEANGPGDDIAANGDVAAGNEFLSDNETNLLSKNDLSDNSHGNDNDGTDVDVQGNETNLASKNDLSDHSQGQDNDGTDVDIQGNKLLSDNLTETNIASKNDLSDNSHGNDNDGTDVDIQDNKLFSDNLTETNVASKNNIDSHDDNRVHVEVKDNETNIGSKNETNVASKNSIDNSTHIDIGDVALSFESNAAVTKADLRNASVFNVVKYEAEKGSGWNEYTNGSSLGEGANSGWAGMSQVNVAAGTNNVSQMSQQVSANIRTLNVQ